MKGTWPPAGWILSFSWISRQAGNDRGVGLGGQAVDEGGEIRFLCRLERRGQR